MLDTCKYWQGLRHYVQGLVVCLFLSAIIYSGKCILSLIMWVILVCSAYGQPECVMTVLWTGGAHMSVSPIFIIPCVITSKVQSPCARLFPPFVRHFWRQLHIVSGSAVDFRVQEVVPSLVCCPSLGCQVSLPLPPLLPWVASTTRPCHQLFCRWAQTFAHRLKNQNFKTLHGNSPLSLSRLTPPLLWKASPPSPTASPTTLQAQETPSPFSRACILGGSEIHSPLLTFNTQLVSTLSSQ